MSDDRQETVERRHSMLQSAMGPAIAAALGDPRVPNLEHARDILLGMRFRLDLFANIRPAATMVQVTALIDPDMLVEIEAEAIVD